MAIINKKLFFILFGLLSLFFVFARSEHSSALSGAPTNIFPDNTMSTNGGEMTTVVQLSPGGVWIKAQTTSASIYVPMSLVDAMGSVTVNLTILGACDTGADSDSGRDYDGAVANTYFQIENLPENNSDFWCGLAPYSTRADLTMSFVATAKASNWDRHDGYYAYRFRAYARDGTEDSRYLNSFKVRADTANVKVGVANFLTPCVIGTYPKSCPPTRTFTDINGVSQTYSYVYSSFFGTANPGGFRIDINNPCATRGKISFYDLDIDTVSQPNMEISIFKNGALLQALPNAGIVNWENGISGFLDPHPGFSGNDNRYIDIPGGDAKYADLGNFDANTDYSVRITGISSSNAIQMIASMTTCPDKPVGTEPLTCTSMSVPNNVAPGQVFNVSVTLKNNTALAIGAGDRVSGYHLGIPNAGGQDPPDHPNGGQWQPINAVSNLVARYDEPYLGQNYQRMPLGVGIPAGGSTSYIFSVTAPTTPVQGKYIGARILNRTAGQWLDYSPTCAKTVNVTQAPIEGSILTGAAYTNCQIISGIARDTDWPGGVFRIHVRFDSSYAANPRPASVQVFTDANGQWSFTIPNIFKTYSARSIWVDALGKNALGAEDQWVALTNSGAVSIGPCRSLPTGVITVSCNASGSQFTVGVNASDNQSPQVNVALTVNRSGGVSNLTGTGSGAITLNPTNTFTPNYGGAASTRTVSGTVTDLDGDVFTMVPVVYSCNPVPLCEINPIPVTVNEQFYLTVTLKNDTPVPTSVSGPANFIVYKGGLPITGGSGTGSPYDTASSTYSTFPILSIPAGGSRVVRSNAPIIVTTAGAYDVRWDIGVATGVNAVGECGRVEPNAIDASVKPYVRFYGNDVVAGGGYGNCTNTPNINVRGYGTFGSGAKNHSTYKGSATELAVFATGGISGVLPGGQETTRTSLLELSFANTTTALPAGEFGGGFGEVLCADDYWADRPATNNPLPVVNAGHVANPSAVKVDVATIPNGVYTYSGDLYMYASVLVPPGKRVTIYNEGRTVIGSISSAGAEILAYNTLAPWGSVGQIPLIKVITKGNIFIDDNVTQVDGLYVAVPNPLSLPNTTGEIHTCSAFGQGIDLTRPLLNKSFIAGWCTRKLTVNGAFIAKRVHLLRSNGNIASGIAGEPYNPLNMNIAEVFRFSPEMYLALLSNGGGSGRFDSILSLPPAL